MPARPARPCTYPGCGALTFDGTGRCAKHPRKPFAGAVRRRAQTYNDSPVNPYRTVQWQQLREMVLRESPLCAECERNGKLTPATEVDHIVAHEGDRASFWDRGNLAGLCSSCHSRKTAREVNERMRKDA